MQNIILFLLFSFTFLLLSFSLILNNATVFKFMSVISKLNKCLLIKLVVKNMFKIIIEYFLPDNF